MAHRFVRLSAGKGPAKKIVPRAQIVKLSHAGPGNGCVKRKRAGTGPTLMRKLRASPAASADANNLRARKTVDLSQVNKAGPVTKMPATSNKRVIAWEGGKILTNKAEALRKFLEKKRKANKKVTAAEKKLIAVALRRNKANTKYVTDMVTMKPDSPSHIRPQNKTSTFSFSTSSIRQARQRRRGQPL